MTVALGLTAAAITTCWGQQGSDRSASLPHFSHIFTVSPIVGIAHIVDGDSIEIAGQAIRLQGIDAPELRQSCERNGAAWPCGVEAAAMLRKLIQDRQVSCAPIAKDRYGRTLGICHAGSDEFNSLNSLMVRSGFALAFIRYSDRYLPEQVAAKAERAGMWSVTFVEPWNFVFSG